MKNKLTKQEQILFDAIIDARKVQEFIWQKPSLNNFDKELCLSVFQKRIDKIREIDFNNKNWKVELRKRILQQAALSIKYLEELQEK